MDHSSWYTINSLQMSREQKYIVSLVQKKKKKNMCTQQQKQYESN